MINTGVTSAIKHLQLQAGETKRINCPSCGGKDTFTVSKIGSSIVWNCYRNSCKIRGSIKAEMSFRDVQTSNIYENEARRKSTRPRFEDKRGKYSSFDIPAHWTVPTASSRCGTYLQKNKCLEAVVGHKAHVRYDPRQDRCVFLIERRGTCYDAIGRGLLPSLKPKWYRYGRSDYGFLVSHMDVPTESICVVEDAASACNVARVMDSMALLGTSINPTTLVDLIDYDEIIIALDPDATDKALKLQAKLRPYAETKVVMLKDDLKYFDPAEIKHALRL